MRIIACRECKGSLSVPDAYISSEVKCPRCKCKFTPNEEDIRKGKANQAELSKHLKKIERKVWSDK